MKGYRAAICTTIQQLGGPSFAHDFLLRDISRGVAATEAKSPRRVPRWDLLLVLEGLRGPPFEPLSSAPLSALTKKTAFLLALATCARRGEIHALSVASEDIAFFPDGDMLLRVLPEFLAKTQQPGTSPRELRIPSMASFVDPRDTDAESILCPVRCLRTYLHRTREHRASQRRLFISVNPAYTKDIAPTTISRWISETVIQTYRGAFRTADLSDPRAHELRALSASIALHRSLSLHSILQSAVWKRESTSQVTTSGIFGPLGLMALNLCPSSQRMRSSGLPLRVPRLNRRSTSSNL